MRSMLFIVLALFFAAPVQAGCPEGEAALHFINAYIKQIETPAMERAEDPVEWAIKTPLVTKEFSVALDELWTEALREFPDEGLGGDPILDAQDYPDAFQVGSCEDGFVLLRSMDERWGDSFTVVLKMVQAPDGRWLVDGSGMVRIPEERQRQE